MMTMWPTSRRQWCFEMRKIDMAVMQVSSRTMSRAESAKSRAIGKTVGRRFETRRWCMLAKQDGCRSECST